MLTLPAWPALPPVVLPQRRLCRTDVNDHRFFESRVRYVASSLQSSFIPARHVGVRDAARALYSHLEHTYPNITVSIAVTMTPTVAQGEWGPDSVANCVDNLIGLLRETHNSATTPLDWVSAEAIDTVSKPLKGKRPRNHRRDSDDEVSGGGSTGADGDNRRHQNHRISGNASSSSGKNNNRKSKGKGKSKRNGNTTAGPGSPGSSSSGVDAPWEVAVKSTTPSGRQAIPNLLAVSLDTDRFTERTREPPTDHPLSSTLAHTRQATADENAAVAAAAHVARVQRNYKTLILEKSSLLWHYPSTLPPTPMNRLSNPFIA